MKTPLSTLLGAALLAGALSVQAQAPAGDAAKAPPSAEQRKERREAMKSRMKEAHEACNSASDKRACMAEQMCARSEDKAKCMARAKEHGERHSKRMDQRQEMHEACNGKRGEELGRCLHEQRGKHRGHDKRS